MRDSGMIMENSNDKERGERDIMREREREWESQRYRVISGR